jgi:hypothetical protein
MNEELDDLASWKEERLPSLFDDSVFQHFANLILDLRFDERPDYDALRGVLGSYIKDDGDSISNPSDSPACSMR